MPERAKNRLQDCFEDTGCHSQLPQHLHLICTGLHHLLYGQCDHREDSVWTLSNYEPWRNGLLRVQKVLLPAQVMERSTKEQSPNWGNASGKQSTVIRSALRSIEFHCSKAITNYYSTNTSSTYHLPPVHPSQMTLTTSLPLTTTRHVGAARTLNTDAELHKMTQTLHHFNPTSGPDGGLEWVLKHCADLFNISLEQPTDLSLNWQKKNFRWHLSYCTAAIVRDINDY